MMEQISGRYHKIMMDDGELICGVWERTPTTAYEGWSADTETNVDRLIRGWNALAGVEALLSAWRASEATGKALNRSQAISELAAVVEGITWTRIGGDGEEARMP